MKTTLKMIATVAVFAFVYSLSAREIATARGAIRSTSSPVLAVTAAVSAPAMSCGKCQDKVATIRDASAKGAQAQLANGAPTKTVSTHMCSACGTKFSTLGAGKGSIEVASHTCGTCK